MKRSFLLVLALFAFAAAAMAATPAKQPVVSGFFQGRTIPYYDFGPIKLKPGNKLAPLWSVTNGAAGQHNIVNTVPARRTTRRCGRSTRSPSRPARHRTS
jgi:hypothetical protein